MSQHPDFTQIALGRPEIRRRPAAGARALHDRRRDCRSSPAYTAEDVAGLDFTDGRPGAAPYHRGPYPTMYVQRPWTVRQYAGFSTAAESNAFYRRNLGRAEGPVGGFRSGHPPRL
jgi:methylmalonyl-CoA mutase